MAGKRFEIPNRVLRAVALWKTAKIEFLNLAPKNATWGSRTSKNEVLEREPDSKMEIGFHRVGFPSRLYYLPWEPYQYECRAQQ
jgi:hypothetical protein